MLEDVVFEAGMELEDILASYHYLHDHYERAMECNSSECHHADIDREALTSWYDRQMAELCHQFAKVILEAM